MKYLRTFLLLSFLYFGSNLFAQTEYLKWKPLIINANQRVWYNESSEVDTANGTFNVWILQTHKPPLEFKQLPGKIYRSKTLYAVNLKSFKYGILQVIYYDVNNKEIYNFNYHIDNYPSDLKYTYPIADNSLMKRLITLLKNPQNKEQN